MGFAMVALVFGLDRIAAAKAADIADLSLEELANIEITSVSKRPERLGDAAASIYVITSDDIRRSGARSIPEILRLAPNLQVARVDSAQYAISSRGFNSTTANKLLVLIDGRSVYTPLFSGVFWDVQDTLPEDIERIEVISGPGGTQWGSNAVNGVINIITRDSRDTQGGFVGLGAGDDERGAAVRHGGRLGEHGNYRIYARQFGRNETATGSGVSRRDAFEYRQGGFRLDWTETGDRVTLQGDSYDGRIGQPVGGDKVLSGGNLLARWSRALADGSALQLQAYFDRTRRTYPGSFAESLDTGDIELQHRFKWGSAHDIVWGGGYRWLRDDVTNSAALAFLPARRDLQLGNLFVQDTIVMSEGLKLSLGLKLEHNSYTGRELLPNVRLGWQVDDRTLLWSAISRAVRTPSRLDRDFHAPGNAPFLIAGGPTFVSEIVTAYELGYRSQPSSRSSFSVSTFYNVHDNLRSVEGGAGGLPPFILGNSMEGETYGIEAWGSHQAADWWRLSAGYSQLHKSLRFKPGSNDVSGLQAAGNDPTQQFSLRSQMNLPKRWELDLSLRVVDKLPNPQVPGYSTVDLRLGWNPVPGVELSLSAKNLFDRRHAEFGAQGVRSEFGRSVFLQLNWRQ